MSGFEHMVERQIALAQAEGKMDEIAGQGKPLPKRPEDAFVSAGERASLRIVAEAGGLPDEITLKKQATAIRAAYRAETDPERQREIMADLSKVELRLALAQDGRRKLMR